MNSPCVSAETQTKRAKPALSPAGGGVGGGEPCCASAYSPPRHPVATPSPNGAPAKLNPCKQKKCLRRARPGGDTKFISNKNNYCTTSIWFKASPPLLTETVYIPAGRVGIAIKVLPASLPVPALLNTRSPMAL